MEENLVIVESPAKAKTIEKFLGKDYLVTSSFGHIRDLDKKKFSIDVEKNYEPQYVIPEDKKKLVTELKKLAKNAQTVWLASDEDREGEAIAWHLSEVLNLKKKNTKRIVFHEITKNAILDAIKSPRDIDSNLVNAQQARRILDRMVGFELSPILWVKVKPSLSAGRVQSVAVRLLVDREREIREFVASASYKITAVFLAADKNGKPVGMLAELNEKFSSKEETVAFLNKCLSAQYKVGDLVTKPSRKSPAPPFTTSTLQQEASRKLGFSVSQTMSIAQKLYEAGKITYMRTDSVNLAETALTAAQEVITHEFGEKYVSIRKYKTKSKGAQEAHEAIRPTSFENETITGNNAEKRLYELIWKRTVASQMSEALLEKTTVTIDISTTREKFIATGEVLKFDGFLKLYIESTDEEDEENGKGLLPPIKVGQSLLSNQIVATERFTHYPPRYTEASLVKKMEELGIGRPSTYAPIISTIQQRGYVVKEDREGKERKYTVLTLKDKKIKEDIKTEITGAEKAKLFPNDIGMIVTDFLVEYFKDILDFNFTAKVEKEFDEIA
ncbi:MAG: type I DNA topoisomerase, partial [Bacteroidota bacterium]|nr:type I DNA topoisomerase [Bacteroidota bacterium]